MYSCNPNEYDEYIRSDKQLPMVKLDENFYDFESSKKESRNHHSFTDLLRLLNSNNTENLRNVNFNLDA